MCAETGCPHAYWWNRYGDATCECGSRLGVTVGRVLTNKLVGRAESALEAHRAGFDSEEWRPVHGHNGVYEVSNLGRVKRIAPASGTHVGRVLNPMTDRKGYLYVRLDGRMQRIHRLVLAAFVGPSEMLCRHLDGDPTNNSLPNLRYGTPLENSADRIAHGRHRLNGRLESSHCRHGHEYTPENTYIKYRAGRRPYRSCRECHLMSMRQMRERKREQASQG